MANYLIPATLVAEYHEHDGQGGDQRMITIKLGNIVVDSFQVPPAHDMEDVIDCIAARFKKLFDLIED